MTHPYHNVSKVRLYTALLSLVLSVLAYYLDDIINRDGILYMDMADAYLRDGLTATAQLYNWPFFSILVAYFHQLSSLSFEISGQVINTLLFVLFTDSLVLLSSKILPTPRQLIIAAALILCFYSINEYRDYIIRDIGYWAFCSLALYRFIRFLEAPNFQNATFWQLSALIAILFRVEGAVILLGLPLYLFLNHYPIKAFKHVLQLNYLLIAGMLVTVVFAIGQSDTTTAFGKINTLINYVNVDSFLSQFNSKADIIGSQVLVRFSADYGGLILASGLIVMLAVKLFKALTLGLVTLYIASIWQQRNQVLAPHKYRRLLVYFSALNILILLVFIFQQYFLVTRYAVMALTSLFLLMLPRICTSIETLWLGKKKLLLSIVASILLLGLIDNLTQSNSKIFIKNTAIWAAQNLPEESLVLTDDKFIRYYFNAHQPKSTLSKKEVTSYSDYNYLIIVEKKRNKARSKLLDAIDLKPIYNNENKRGDRATIYKIIAD